MAKKSSSKRTRISPRGNTRFVRRRKDGTIRESDEAGRSVAQDRRKNAKTKAPKGQRDRGDS